MSSGITSRKMTDLLFGVIALEMGFLSKEQFAAVCAAWGGEGESEFARTCVDFGYLKYFQCEAVEAVVRAHLKTHDGDAVRSLDAIVISPDVKDILLGLGWDEVMRQTLRALPVSASSGGQLLSRPAADKYTFQKEVGRGGIGRVVAAVDNDIRRVVAIKMLGEDAPPEMMERFLREARLTGRLEHPNIVTVHDLGVLPFGEKEAEAGRQPYFCMRFVRGRNLGEILAACVRGDEATRKTFTRPRLLSIFQQICMGIAFAHDHGVIHRDLKPQNVMIGDYGETLIVDWGLAKAIGTDDPQKDPARAALLAPAAEPTLTQDGDIVGTPTYMSPEQAQGQNAQVDERSDIYALGAILYEILTWHPPYEGRSVFDVLQMVRDGALTPPTRRLSEISRREPVMGERVDPPPAGYTPPAIVSSANMPSADPIPRELETICMRAMAFRREDRFPSARALHDEIQAFLEGARERERLHQLAEEQVRAGEEFVAKHRQGKADLARARQTCADIARRYAGWETPNEKHPLWETEDRIDALEQEVITHFTGATARFTMALGFEKDHPRARAGLADLYWEKFAEAEGAGNEKAMLFNRQMVELYDDGWYKARLVGDGTLSVETSTYACDCLRPPTPGAPARKTDRLRKSRAHGPGCVRVPVRGVDVWLHSWTEWNRRLVLTAPKGVKGPKGDGAAAEGGTGKRGLPAAPVAGDGLYLGQTPIAPFSLPMGSYCLVVRRSGDRECRVPFAVARQSMVALQVTLFREDEIGPDFLHVPAGSFPFGGERAGGGRSGIRESPDFFCARYPVTCADYLEFLNDLARERPDEARKRVPRESPDGPAAWSELIAQEADRRRFLQFRIPMRGDATRKIGTKMDWHPHWPVVGVSWHDAMAYADWRSRREGRVFSLPHEEQWEKAARGTDGRLYPFGNKFDATFCNVSSSHKEGPRLLPVGTFPEDISPYGVCDLAGNARTWCLDEVEVGHKPGRVIRGGAWDVAGTYSRAAVRFGDVPENVNWRLGIRLVCEPAVRT
ncbi:MAG: SUMF1/EgtB/PvdO family nonheme iron enzyme [Planctomycetes bacterium]|nr:SUMF1/EgtB/PvdO family nonheme iron enzyme [Planctomycetota bacterium]